MTIDESGPVAAPLAPAAVAPDLLVRTEAGTHQLRAGNSYRIGRDPQGHIVLADPRVSWAHGELRVDGGTWTYFDTSSRNGTFLGQDKISRVEVTTSGRMLRLGQPDDGSPMALLPLPAEAPQAAAPAAPAPAPQAPPSPPAPSSEAPSSEAPSPA